MVGQLDGRPRVQCARGREPRGQLLQRADSRLLEHRNRRSPGGRDGAPHVPPLQALSRREQGLCTATSDVFWTHFSHPFLSSMPPRAHRVTLIGCCLVPAIRCWSRFTPSGARPRLRVYEDGRRRVHPAHPAQARGTRGAGHAVARRELRETICVLSAVRQAGTRPT